MWLYIAVCCTAECRNFANMVVLQHSSGFKKAEDDANQEAEEKLKEIQAAGKKQGDKVVQDLIKATTDVKPQVPEKIVA